MSPSGNSSNPYAPNISPEFLWMEHAAFAGDNLGEIFYGMVIVLYFQTIAALMSPVHRKGKTVKWGLVGYSTVMFLLVTTFTAMNVRLQQLSYIDNRDFPGIPNSLPPGPIGWGLSMYSKPLVIVPNACFVIANWLADGLLMYRCYVIYDMQRWVLIFPFTLYLASVSMGTMTFYHTSQPNSNLWHGTAENFGVPYFTISVGLNVILTLMISIRLILHSRNIQGTMGPASRVSSLCKTIVAMLVESSALYAISSFLFIGPFAAENYASDIFLPILAEVQVIAPLLIIHRVATQNALTSTTVVSGAPTSGGMSFRTRPGSQITTTDSTLVGYPLSSMGNKYGNRNYEERIIGLPVKV